MGRTAPTFTLLTQEYESRWRKFRAALRKEDQDVFDELFQAPKIHLAACAYAMNPFPFENILMAMLLEEHKKIVALERAIKEITHVDQELDSKDADNTRMVV
ncbi:MAG TPA: hypothetical protein VLX91_12710 [Candidatus Acidoferrales bacterium]|nr:hypothetical protein [Candidatus Acidoferrales bacterium]